MKTSFRISTAPSWQRRGAALLDMADYTAAVAACEEGLELDWIALILVALSLSDGPAGPAGPRH